MLDEIFFLPQRRMSHKRTKQNVKETWLWLPERARLFHSSSISSSNPPANGNLLTLNQEVNDRVWFCESRTQSSLQRFGGSRIRKQTELAYFRAGVSCSADVLFLLKAIFPSIHHAAIPGRPEKRVLFLQHQLLQLRRGCKQTPARIPQTYYAPLAGPS